MYIDLMIWITPALNSASRRVCHGDVAQGRDGVYGVRDTQPAAPDQLQLIPKPVLDRLGNPDGLKFVFRGDDILVVRPD